jgi:hypothetical protein
VDLQPGDIGFSTIPGRVGGWVSLGQALLRDECWFTHTWIVSSVWAGGVRVVEAMPGGARHAYLAPGVRQGPGYGWIRLPLTLEQRASVTEYAEAAIGVPYSFLDYASLALLHLGWPRRWTARRVSDSGHLICSQLVDHVLCQAGYHIFRDGRLSQDVTPGALFRAAGAQGQVCWA